MSKEVSKNVIATDDFTSPLAGEVCFQVEHERNLENRERGKRLRNNLVVGVKRVYEFCCRNTSRPLPTIRKCAMTVAVILSEAKNLIKYNEITIHSTNTRNDRNLLLIYLPTNFLTCKRYAFTLAEVLITLGIIGVVAAMTLPNLIQDYKLKRTVTQLKYFDSVLQNAYKKLLYSEFDGENTGGWSGYDVNDFVDIFAKQLHHTRICYKGNSYSCIKNIAYKNLNGTSLSGGANPGDQGEAIIMLNNGVVLMVSFLATSNPTYYNTYKIAGQIYVDLNGDKAPNVLGRDVFSYFIMDNSLLPRGYSSVSKNLYHANNYCSAKTTIAGHNGLGCTAWVIYNENMDYLKCDDLVWGKKTKCESK